MDENQFNKIPAGYEAVILNVTVTVDEWNLEDDSSYFISSFVFDLFDDNYNALKRESGVFPDKFGGELYEGGTLTGNVGFIVPECKTKYVRTSDILWLDIEKP